MKRFLFRLWGGAPIPFRLRQFLVWAAADKFLVGVIAAIFNPAGEILLFHHTYRGERYPWGPPAGWLKPDEDPDQAIVREILEETGLDIRPTRILLTETSGRFRRVDIIVLCEITGGVFRPSAEVDEIRYFPEGNLPPMMRSQYVMISKIFNQWRRK